MHALKSRILKINAALGGKALRPSKTDSDKRLVLWIKEIIELILKESCLFPSATSVDIVLFIIERKKTRENFQKTCTNLRKFQPVDIRTENRWEKIHFLESRSIPTLISNNWELKTDAEKGRLFGELLSATLSPNLDLNTTEKGIIRI
ncbi:hypothetical protein BpHYR1_031370 [Brachionus plicatilis]|uniref:Uncharacterized protein n=1 Tax=Brachionus plicatilis TaxID=10195 RepID=A0A3M7PJ13_BRAPC|nr:hypothetical protein BpHYR1_031370 [Brachionus plicatilis]